MTSGVDRRGQLTRAVRRSFQPVITALVTAEADPPARRPEWRTPAPIQFVARFLPVDSVDVVVIGELLAALAVLAGTSEALTDLNARAADPVDGELILLAAVAAAAPLVLRDRWPLAAWRLSIPSMLLTVAVTRDIHSRADLADAYPYLPGAVLTYLLVLYAVGVRCPRRVSIVAWVLSVLGMWILHPEASVLLGAMMTGVALVFGYNVRVRRVAQRKVVEEERRTEDERAARAVLEERSRIARELHDVVAHHMSVIAIQAEAAPIRSPDDPAALTTELAGIRSTALEALTELRRVLGLLRDGARAPETAPQPGLPDLDRLVASARAAGSGVTVTVRGRPPDDLAGVGLAVYRVVQESLSNARRHAPDASVRVWLDYRPDRIDLRVENGPPSAPPRPPGRSGQGLTGMRERVNALGGTLTTGPTGDGGFAVLATLPLPDRGPRQPDPEPAPGPGRVPVPRQRPEPGRTRDPGQVPEPARRPETDRGRSSDLGEGP